MRPRRAWESRGNLVVLLTLAPLGCGTCNPWPEPPPSKVAILVAIPGELDVFIDDPARGTVVNLIGMTYDRYGIPIANQQLQFSPNPTAGVQVTPVGASGDTVALAIDPGTATDRTIDVQVTHPTTGLTVSVPVHLHFARAGGDGAEVPAPPSRWPMVGLASGQVGPDWQRNLMRAFVRRVDFAKFDVPPPSIPPGDEPSGTVLSSSHRLWRQADPWHGDVSLPNGTEAKPAVIPVTLVFLGDNYDAARSQFLIDVQAGADIVDNSLVGATVEVESQIRQGQKVTWTDDCSTLGSGLPPEAPPETSRLVVYMVARTSESAGDLPLRCGPGTMGNELDDGANAIDVRANAIFLPEGPVSSASVAHEIGHALSLSHVTFGSGFFDSNLMVEATTGAGSLRDRFTVGQAFRAALDPSSWLVLANLHRPPAIDCSASIPKCPALNADISRRTP